MCRNGVTGSAGNTVGALTGQCVHRRKILSAITITIFARLVQESTIPIIALLIAEKRRAIFGGPILRPKIDQLAESCE
jgi:hypothetical protein